MQPGLSVLILSLLLGLQPITTDLYLPALPALTAGFGAPMAQGLSKTQYGLLMFSMAFAYILGTFLCRRLLPRFGVHQPCSQSGALAPFPQAAGAASALNGFLMMAAAFAMGGWLGSHMDGTVFPLAYGLWFWSVLIALAAWTLVQKYGKTLGH